MRAEGFVKNVFSNIPFKDGIFFAKINHCGSWNTKMKLHINFASFISFRNININDYCE